MNTMSPPMVNFSSFCLHVQRRKYHIFWLKCNTLIQWGSEIQISLDFEWSKKGLVANGPDFEWDLKSMSPTDHWNTKPFEIRTSKSLVFKSHIFFFWIDMDQGANFTMYFSFQLANSQLKNSARMSS